MNHRDTCVLNRDNAPVDDSLCTCGAYQEAMNRGALSFEDWWKGSGQVRGEAIFRNCWDAAIARAAREAESSMNEWAKTETDNPHEYEEIGMDLAINIRKLATRK